MFNRFWMAKCITPARGVLRERTGARLRLEELESRTVPSAFTPAHGVHADAPHPSALDSGQSDHGGHRYQVAPVVQAYDELSASRDTSPMGSRNLRRAFDLVDRLPLGIHAKEFHDFHGASSRLDARAASQARSSAMLLIADDAQQQIGIGTPGTANVIDVSMNEIGQSPTVVLQPEYALFEVTAAPTVSSGAVPIGRMAAGRAAATLPYPDAKGTVASPMSGLPSRITTRARAGSEWHARQGDGQAARVILNPVGLVPRVGPALAEHATSVDIRLERILSPAPIVCDLLTNAFAGDLRSLALDVQRLIDGIEALGVEAAESGTHVSLTTWLIVFSVSAAMFEGVRLLIRRSQAATALSMGAGGEPISGPDPVGQTPVDLR